MSMSRISLKTATYWLTTSLLALDFAVGGAFQLRPPAQVASAMAHLGYPAYFVIWLGVWKLLGAAALLVPGLPRLKEWAYAGIFFDLTSAAVSIVAVGDGFAAALIPLLFLVLALTSCWTRPPSRTLARAPRANVTQLNSLSDADLSLHMSNS